MTAKDPTHLIGRLTETARDALQRIVRQLEPLEQRGELSNPLGGFIDTDLKFPPEFYSADAKGLLELRTALRTARWALQNPNLDPEILLDCQAECEAIFNNGAHKYELRREARAARSKGGAAHTKRRNAELEFWISEFKKRADGVSSSHRRTAIGRTIVQEAAAKGVTITERQRKRYLKL